MKLNRKKLNEIKNVFQAKRNKADDLDIIVTQLLELPPGQLKKVLTDEVLAVLEKYGYTED